VRAALDFSFVRRKVAHCYGYNGNESIDPEVILKLMFVLFLDNVKSERELMRMLPERLDYLWFLGFGLDDDIPDHSVLSKARARWGREIFESLFVRTVQECVNAGLVASHYLTLPLTGRQKRPGRCFRSIRAINLATTYSRGT
jgi:transposase